MFDTYVGTTKGIFRIEGSALEPLGLDGERVSAVHAWRASGGTTVLAGTYESGLYRREDGRRRWERVEAGLTAPCFRCIGPDPLEPNALLAGTEPARLFRSRDGGRTWRELDGIRRIEEHEQWFLPYSPRAGALRNVWAPPGSSATLFASVEVGGLLRSDDGGEAWRCDPVVDDDDIHYVTGDPRDPSLLYAALGYASLRHRNAPPDQRPQLGGIGRSRDGGRTWQKLETDYTRAVLVPPARPDLLLAGPAPHVGREGRIVVSDDGGDTWQPAADGLDVPMPDMVELFVPAPDGDVWAVCSGGRLLRATPGEWHWRSAVPADAPPVQSVAFV
jgi:hypothetical protein